MTFSTTFRRPLVAAVALAAGAAIALTGCSSDDSSDSATSTTAAESAASGTQAASELTVEQAQTTLRKALDSATPEAELDGVVQFTDPTVKTSLVEYNKAAAKGGYTPDIYTVKSVKVDGDKAAAVVAVKSPHAPAAIDMTFNFVKVDGTWKVASDAVTQLTSMMTQHG
ncbi:hypothetical protein nbrc107696_03600 [Gordonia spumicola]|uniref:Low molecular weight antigen MTB12-like C-terminal domain-containing protein n=1 Tax=Gordonia spumicola TaxID=589161 RepID=A0A7I9V419_9ACTN|nr:DUF4878 domain-containing protein [Gordonia spumicola]GED99913.1 hypothetical protein nbrc107696_03600 [Gordonia spumicola]